MSLQPRTSRNWRWCEAGSGGGDGHDALNLFKAEENSLELGVVPKAEVELEGEPHWVSSDYCVIVVASVGMEKTSGAVPS